jgi:hypothetical protein
MREFSHSPSDDVCWRSVLALQSSLEAHGLLLRRHGREQVVLARSACDVRINIEGVRWLLRTDCPIILCVLERVPATRDWSSELCEQCESNEPDGKK